MKVNGSIPYERQIFVCTNVNSDDKPCCGGKNGDVVFRTLREHAKAIGVHPRIRVAQAKCLGQCASGVTVMVYPDNTWCSLVSEEDCKQLAKTYIG